MDSLAQYLEITKSLDLTAFISVLFVIIHLVPEQLYTLFYRSNSVATNFGGGMAIAYVFIHLLPEIEIDETLLGVPLHFIALIGFLIFYGMERLAWIYAYHSIPGEAGQEHEESELSELSQNDFARDIIASLPSERWIFNVQILFSGVYSFLLIYAMPEEFEHGVSLALLYALAMGLHLLSTDYKLGQEYPQEFIWGRYVLVLGTILGFTTDLLVKLPNERTFHFLMAILAGSLLYNIFQEELPEPETSSFRWFIAGVFFYAFLLTGSWQLNF